MSDDNGPTARQQRGVDATASAPRPADQRVVTDTMGDSKRVTVYGGTAAETRAKAAQIRARVAEGQPAKDRKQTVKAYAQQWIETSLEASD